MSIDDWVSRGLSGQLRQPPAPAPASAPAAASVSAESSSHHHQQQQQQQATLQRHLQQQSATPATGSEPTPTSTLSLKLHNNAHHPQLHAPTSITPPPSNVDTAGIKQLIDQYDKQQAARQNTASTAAAPPKTLLRQTSPPPNPSHYFADESRPRLREIVQYAAATAPVGQTIGTQWQRLMKTVAPASLSHHPAVTSRLPLLHTPTPASQAVDSHRASDSTTTSLSSVDPRLAALQPCDLVIVRTPGKLYSLLRGLTSQRYDHLAVIMRDTNQVLHIGPPIIRLLPTQLLLEPHRNPLVLRPKLTAAEKELMLNSLSTLVGKPYDTLSVLKFVSRLAFRRYFNNTTTVLDYNDTLQPNNDKQPQQKLFESDSTAAASSQSGNRSVALICTDAILNRLTAISPAFARVKESASYDNYHLQSWSISDVLRLYKAKLLETVALPTNTTPSTASTPTTTTPARPPVTLGAAIQQRRKQWRKRVNKAKFAGLMWYMEHVPDETKEKLTSMFEFSSNATQQLAKVFTPSMKDVISFIQSPRKRQFLAAYLLVRRYLPFKYWALSTLTMIVVVMEGAIRHAISIKAKQLLQSRL